MSAAWLPDDAEEWGIMRRLLFHVEHEALMLGRPVPLEGRDMRRLLEHYEQTRASVDGARATGLRWAYGVNYRGSVIQNADRSGRDRGRGDGGHGGHDCPGE